MKANITFDLTCHFGIFKNLELPTRGIYCVSVTLLCGGEKVNSGDRECVTPHGCFSASMKLSSFVGDYELPAVKNMDMCDIVQLNQQESYFKTRNFVIRYRDEYHIINEGVHWKIMLQDVDLSLLDHDIHLISCQDLLTMRFSLYQCDFVNANAHSDLMNCIDEHLPDSPEMKFVGHQDIYLQQVSSGFHQYFPMSFTSHLDVCLDVMIHCAVTKVSLCYHIAALCETLTIFLSDWILLDVVID